MEHGFYWVTLRPWINGSGDAAITIAKWDGEHWWLIGYTDPYRNGDLTVGARIKGQMREERHE